MLLSRLVAKNAFRHQLRTALTVVGIVVAITAFGLLRTLLSNYWKLRSRLGLTRYGDAAMLEKLDAAGFDAELAPANIGHNRARRAFYARRR